jgi:asparagine synthase (glutamine-hydrolysing)
MGVTARRSFDGRERGFAPLRSYGLVCGIGALLDPGLTAPREAGAAMIGALRHRGPDGEGYHSSGPALLVHTRLAIIDVTGGHQPLASEDGECAAVVNGEIYNHVALRGDLEARGHRFATRSDSEVIVHAYEEHGTDCVRRLNGIFAFAVWDNRRQKLVVARDPYGVKPLYWWTDGRRLAVASEVAALLATGLVSPALDRVALDHYLAWRFVPAPRTLFRGISKLPPASLLTADVDGVLVESYREPPGATFDDISAEDLTEELARQVTDAVERQTMSEVPYGAFLSGGMDSAAIAAAMSARTGQPTNTFTIGFPGHGDAVDERQYAAATARALGTDHRATALEEGDFSLALSECIFRLEEPCGVPSAPALLQLSRFAANSVKVVLSGQGADEPLGGYQRHQAAAALGLVKRLPSGLGRPAHAMAVALTRNERVKRAAAVMSASPGDDRLLRIFEITDGGLRIELTGHPSLEAEEERRRIATEVLADVADRDPLEQALYLDTRVFLPDGLLVYGDKMSMAYGLEHRVPFLDLELMRFVERIPAGLRVRRLRRKWLYRRAMRPLVPAEVLRRRKHPFATPYDDWLRSSLGEEVERRFVPGTELAGLVDARVVSRLVAGHRGGIADHKRILYCLLELAEWHRSFLERSGTPAADPGPAAERGVGSTIRP